MALPLAVLEVALRRTPCATRLPFRFGATTVTQAELLTCRVTCRSESGRREVGYAADLLVPRWFRKDLEQPPSADSQDLVDSAIAAATACVAQLTLPDAVFAATWQVFLDRVLATKADAPDRLLRGFGVALLERALLDAASRLADLPFAEALVADVFGFRPERIHAELAAWDWQRELPKPQPTLATRHTVGMLDVLRTRDIPPERRVADGLPQALQEDLAAYGHRWLKVKIGAGPERDAARLLELADFLAEVDRAPGLTLDGNEQYPTLSSLADMLDAVAAHGQGRLLLARLAWIEQPLPRALTFDAAANRGIERVRKYAPLLLDEADAAPDSLPQALALGYSGISVKNCKGVQRALANFGMCRRRVGCFQSSEDLTNLGALPLQQDLVTAAVLGLPHSERNGHHYFAGLQHLPPDEVEQTLAVHGDLYRPLGDGASLRIAQGRLSFSSVLACKGYGHALHDLRGEWRVVAGS